MLSELGLSELTSDNVYMMAQAVYAAGPLDEWRAKLVSDLVSYSLRANEFEQNLRLAEEQMAARTHINWPKAN